MHAVLTIANGLTIAYSNEDIKLNPNSNPVAAEESFQVKQIH